MSGTIPLSLTQQLDEYGQPLSGGQLYIIQAGTVSTPQNPFQDTALTILLPNPITLDAAGRIPQFFLADGQIKVRLQDALGVVKFVADNILVIGPSGGSGGGGGSVDPTTVMQTGDLKARYDTAIISGFVRANGNTIGSSSSGANELADPSAQPLFLHLWLKDPNLAVTPGGRGASGAADWAANKQIATPDWRGCAISALDDMGAAPAGRLTAAYFGVAATVLGAFGGSQSHTLVPGELALHTHGYSGTTGGDSPDHSHPYTAPTSGPGTGTSPNYFSSSQVAANTGGASTRHTHPYSGSTDTGAGVGGAPHSIVSPRKLCTIYIKL
jgi:hypothetical protein